MKAHPPNPLVKLARVGVGLTRDETARQANIHPRKLRRIENGDGPYRVTAAIAERLAAVFAVTPGFLFPQLLDRELGE